MTKEHLYKLGKRIKQVREKLGLKQKDFAAVLAVSGSLISQIEKGHKNPVYELLYKMMTEYHVSLDWLFTGKGDMFLKNFPDPKDGKETEIDDITDVSDLMWYLEHSNLINLNVMGFAARFFFENEKHIKDELKRHREKKKKEPNDESNRNQENF